MITPPVSEATGDQGATTDEGEATGPAIEVGVVEGALRFDPSELTAEAGSVTFRFTNTEPTTHDFVIEENEERVAGTDLISNDTAEVSVFLEPGRYTFICTPHEAAGMTGILTVD